MQFPFVVPTRYEHPKSADSHYNISVHENKINTAFNVAKTVVPMSRKHGTRTHVICA